MKKSMYVFGSIEVILGALLLWATKMIAEVLPILGYAAFQFHGGSYSASNYELALGLPYLIAALLIIGGLAQIIFSFMKAKE